MGADPSVYVRGMALGIGASSITPGFKDPLSIQATILLEPSSATVSGTGLWKLSVYGSTNAQGTGEQFQRIDQVLSTAQQAQPVVDPVDGPLTSIGFLDAYGEMDLIAIGCGEYGFICADFTKGDNPSPDFNFVSLQQADSSKFRFCQEIPCPLHEGLFS